MGSTSSLASAMGRGNFDALSIFAFQSTVARSAR